MATQDQETSVSSREVDISSRTLSGGADNLAAAPVKPKDETPIAGPVVETPEVIVFADSARGKTLLNKAETAYAAYGWEEARSTANLMRSLDIEPEVKARAEDIIEGSKRLADLFDILSTREELVRNLETHPSLVQITMRGKPTG